MGKKGDSPILRPSHRTSGRISDALLYPGQLEGVQMHVAVTGGSGFIGKSVVSALDRGGHTAQVLDRAVGTDILEADLGCLLGRSDAVIHLAGVLGTAELFDDPMNAIQVNVGGTLKVLQACSHTGAKFIGITMPAVWPNVYQATKRCARDLASAWHHNYQVPVSHVRAFNAFGPHQKHYGVQKIIPTFAVHAWRNLPIPIWGDGSQTVDLVFVDDLATMLVDALQFGNDEVLDGGTGKALTVKQIADLVISMTGSTAGIEYLPMRRGEVQTTIVADGEGWHLLKTHPEFRMEDLRRTVEWYRAVALNG